MVVKHLTTKNAIKANLVEIRRAKDRSWRWFRYKGIITLSYCNHNGKMTFAISEFINRELYMRYTPEARQRIKACIDVFNTAYKQVESISLAELDSALNHLVLAFTQESYSA